MTKQKFIFICFTIAIIAAITFYYNSEKVISYFENKEWEIADSIGSVSLSNYIEIEGTLSNLIVIGSNFVRGYSHEAQKEFDMFLSFQDTVSDSDGDYCIVGEKNGTAVYMINGKEKVWENSITGSIYDVYVNKNGYAAVIYKQSGYKSLVKVISPLGVELFTSYLASTYAIDVAITNDNKTLAIAEVDTDGIHIMSTVKVIDINNLDNQNVKKYSISEGGLITDIEYTSENDLLVMTDSTVEIIQNGQKIEKLSYDYNSTKMVTIENKNNAITIEKEDAGLFDMKYKLCIYSFDDKKETKEYELYDLPKQIKANNNMIVLVMEDELLIINTNGKLVKKCDVSRNIKSIVLFNNANTIGLIFRDKIDFIKL